MTILNQNSSSASASFVISQKITSLNLVGVPVVVHDALRDIQPHQAVVTRWPECNILWPLSCFESWPFSVFFPISDYYLILYPQLAFVYLFLYFLYIIMIVFLFLLFSRKVCVAYYDTFVFVFRSFKWTFTRESGILVHRFVSVNLQSLPPFEGNYWQTLYFSCRFVFNYYRRPRAPPPLLRPYAPQSGDREDMSSLFSFEAEQRKRDGVRRRSLIVSLKDRFSSKVPSDGEVKHFVKLHARGARFRDVYPCLVGYLWNEEPLYALLQRYPPACRTVYGPWLQSAIGRESIRLRILSLGLHEPQGWGLEDLAIVREVLAFRAQFVELTSNITKVNGAFSVFGQFADSLFTTDFFQFMVSVWRLTVDTDVTTLAVDAVSIYINPVFSQVVALFPVVKGLFSVSPQGDDANTYSWMRCLPVVERFKFVAGLFFGSHFFKNRGDAFKFAFSSLAESCSTVVADVNFVTGAFSFMSDFLESVAGYFKTGSWDFAMLSPDAKMCKRLQDAILEIEHPERASLLSTSEDRVGDFLRLLDEANRLINSHPKNLLFRSLLDTFSSLFQSFRTSGSFTSKAPLGVIVVGPPGTGKSELVKMCGNRLAKAMSLPAGTNTVFKFEPAVKYQKVPAAAVMTTVEDFFQTKAEKLPEDPLSLLQRLVEAGPFTVERASLEEKRLSDIANKLVMITCNPSSYTLSQSVNGGESKLDRRYDVLVCSYRDWVEPFMQSFKKGWHACDYLKQLFEGSFRCDARPEGVSASLGPILYRYGRMVNSPGLTPVIRFRLSYVEFETDKVDSLVSYIMAKMNRRKDLPKEISVDTPMCPGCYGPSPCKFSFCKSSSTYVAQGGIFSSVAAAYLNNESSLRRGGGVARVIAGYIKDHPFTEDWLRGGVPVSDDEFKSLQSVVDLSEVVELCRKECEGLIDSLGYQPKYFSRRGFGALPPYVQRFLVDAASFCLSPRGYAECWKYGSRTVHLARFVWMYGPRVWKEFTFPAVGLILFGTGVFSLLKTYKVIRQGNLIGTIGNMPSKFDEQPRPVVPMVRRDLASYLVGGTTSPDGFCFAVSMGERFLHAVQYSQCTILVPRHFFQIVPGEVRSPFVPDGTEFLVKGQKFKFESSLAVVAPRDVDLVMYYLGTVAGTGKCVKDYLATSHPPSHLWWGKNDVLVSQVSEDHVTLRAQTRNGDCGLLYTQSGLIYSMHVGTLGGTMAVSVRLRHDYLENMRSVLLNRGLVDLLDDLTPHPAMCAELDKLALGAHPESDLSWFMKGKSPEVLLQQDVQVIGHLNHAPRPSASCRKTALFPYVGHLCEEFHHQWVRKAVLVDGEWKSPFMSRFGANLNSPVPVGAFHYVLHRKLRLKPPGVKLGPISLEQALLGDCDNDYISAIDPTKSPGPVYSLQKIHRKDIFSVALGVITILPQFYERYDQIMSGISSGRGVLIHSSATVKDEVVKKSAFLKGKGRTFEVTEKEFNVVMKQFAKNLTIQFFEQWKTTGFCGFLNFGGKDGQQFHDHLCGLSEPLFVMGDFSKFDHSHARLVALACVLVRREAEGIGYSPGEALMLSQIVLNAFTTLSCSEGNYTIRRVRLPSGIDLTFFLNCLINDLILDLTLRYVFPTEDTDVLKAEHVRVAYAGDDFLFSVSKHLRERGFRASHVQEFAGTLGYVITRSDKLPGVLEYISIREVNFVKREFAWHDGHVFCSLEKQSIFKSLSYCCGISEQDERERNKNAVACNLREAFLHGRAFFEEVFHLMRKAYTDGVLASVPDFTYDDLMEEYERGSFRTWNHTPF